MLPPYLIDPIFWRDALFPLLFSILISYLLAKSMRFSNRQRTHLYFITILSVSLLGMTIGVMVGLSREPAVNAAIPAILSLAGGVFIYLVGVKKPTNQYLVILASMGLVLSIYFGSNFGAKVRGGHERYLGSADYKLTQLRENHILNLEKIKLENELNILKAAYIKKDMPKNNN